MSPIEIVAGLAVLLVVGVALGRRKKRRVLALLEPVANKRDGTVRTPVGGMPSIRFEHRAAEAELAFRRRGSPSAEHSGRHFRMTVPLPSSTGVRLYVRRRPTRVSLRGVEEIPVSGGGFDARFRVHTDDRAVAQEALTPGLRERLTAFPHRIAVKVEEDEATVEWAAAGLPKDGDELDGQLESALRVLDELLAAVARTPGS